MFAFVNFKLNDMEAYFHLFSDGALAPDFIVSEQDYIATVNRLAVQTFVYGVVILSFGIEDTHLHFLVRGEPVNCRKLKNAFQKETRCYLKYTRKQNFSTVFVLDMEEITDEDYLRSVGTYTITQATKDGKKIMPYDYKWCTAALYFRRVDIDALWVGDRQVIPVAGLSLHRRQEILRTKAELPGGWRICGGLILPSSFVDIPGFEKIYKTHNAFRVFCSSSREKDNRIVDSMARVRGFSYEEYEARELCRKVCKRLFNVSDVYLLTANQRISLARSLRKEFNMGFSQLARRVHLPEIEIIRNLK